MASTRDEIYKNYLEEMQSLENFRVSYTSVRPGAKVEREDPEVQRLIDAMAFFTARTRTSTLKNLLVTQRRLFEQYFAFLLTPMPAAGLLQAQPTGRFVEPAMLPRGTEIVVTPEGAPGAFFHVVSDIKILPLQLESIDTLLRQKAGFRVVMTFRSRFPRNEEVGVLPLLVNHLDDYRASLGVLWNLQKHLEGVTVVYGEDKVDDLTQGVPCEVSYGSAQDPDVLPELTHPLQRIREFLHLPQRDLYFNVKLAKAPPQWKQFSLILDLGASWPRALRLNTEMFQLFTVPI
ncbi:MAG: type VI secretion system baseplate subunit TssF, partial [Planctomycetota bacterium]